MKLIAFGHLKKNKVCIHWNEIDCLWSFKEEYRCVYIEMKLSASGHLKKNKGVYILE